MAKKVHTARTGSMGLAASSHYKVLARRWRPQQFDELVGQEAIGQALKGAIEAGRVAHAYLFAGARGVGKTSTARILAKALNCREGPTCTPCDRCEVCLSVASGDDVDVLEIDGASNRGIDEVRELRQNASFRATRSRYKIYIIDEVHMLTREAFNALLKTLEEPPAHVKFIFATTDPQKIPVTILSRCQRFDFAGISGELIQRRLREIVDSERTGCDEEVLELLARRAGGSMRDAQSLLDQLLAFGEQRITAEQVHRLLGTAREDRLVELVEGLSRGDSKGVISLVDRAEAEGVRFGELIDQLLEYFRDLMVAQSAGPEARLLSVSQRNRRRVVEQASRWSADSVLAATEILAETKGRLRGSDHGRVLVDLALLRIARLEDLRPLGELVEWVAEMEARLGVPAADAPGPAGAAVKKNAGPVDRPSALPSTTHRPEEVLSVESASELLSEVAQDLSPVLAESLARAKVSVGPQPNLLVVLLDAVYNSPRRAREIESLLQQRVSSGIRIRVDFSKQVHSDRDARPAGRLSYSERLGEAARDALVQEVIDLFGARVVRVDDS